MAYSIYTRTPGYQERRQSVEDELDEMKEFMGDVIPNEIISRQSRNENENCNVINDGLLQMHLRTAPFSPASADLHQKIDKLAEMTAHIIDTFGRIYEIAKEEGFPIDKIVEDREKLKEFLGLSIFYSSG
jgi:hypothetical protein